MSNPVIFFIREHLNGYVILFIFILFIYFGFLRRKFQKEAFKAYVGKNELGLSKLRDKNKIGDKVSKKDKKKFVDKYTKEKVNKIRFLEDKEKMMKRRSRENIKNTGKYEKNVNSINKKLIKNTFKKEIKDLKKEIYDNKLDKVLSVQENFTNQIPNNDLKENINSNNISSRHSNKFQDAKDDKKVILKFKNSPIKFDDAKITKINKHIVNSIEPKLILDFEKIDLSSIGIVKFNEELDKLVTTYSKKTIDHIYDNIVTLEKELEILITIENKKRIYYNNVITNLIKNHLKIKINNYVNEKIPVINKKLINQIKEVNKKIDSRDTQLQDIYKLKEKLFVSLNQYQYLYGKKMKNDETIEVLKQLQKFNIQPKYETQYDINNSLIKQQFDGDESSLSNKYGQAYQDHIKNEKNEKMLVNPGELLSNLEENAISLTEGITNIFNSNEVKNNLPLIEPFSEYTNENTNYVNSLNRFDRFNNPDNFGSYLTKYGQCNKPLNQDIEYGNYDSYDKIPSIDTNLEGFQNNKNKQNKNNKNNNLNKFMNSNDSFKDSEDNKDDEEKKDDKEKKDDDKTTLDKLMGGDFINGFLEYILDNGTSFMNNYDKKFDDLGNLLDKKDNMMTFGLGLVILSIVMYFADITSSSSNHCSKCNS